jgi:hypothetical protein
MVSLACAASGSVDMRSTCRDPSSLLLGRYHTSSRCDEISSDADVFLVDGGLWTLSLAFGGRFRRGRRGQVLSYSRELSLQPGEHPSRLSSTPAQHVVVVVDLWYPLQPTFVNSTT